MVTPVKSVFEVMPDYRQTYRSGLDGEGGSDDCSRSAIGVTYCRENHFLCSVALKNGMGIVEDLL